MLLFYLLFITILTFFGVSAACFSFIVEKNRLLAITHKSSIYDKGASHLAVLSATLSLFLGLALILDFYLNGVIASYFIKPNNYNLLFISSGLLFLLLCFFFILMTKTSKVLKNIFLKFNLLLGLVQLLLVAILSWASISDIPFYSSLTDLTTATPDDLKNQTNLATWLQNFTQISFYLYVIFCLLLGLFGAHTLALLFMIFRRNKDDFGRDYYNILLKSHSKRAVNSGVLTLIIAVVFCILYPLTIETLSALANTILGFVISPDLSSGIKSSWEYYALLPFGFIVLALFFLQSIAVAAFPMQRKSFAFIAFILIILGIIPFYFQILNFNSALFLL